MSQIIISSLFCLFALNVNGQDSQVSLGCEASYPGSTELFYADGTNFSRFTFDDDNATAMGGEYDVAGYEADYVGSDYCFNDTGCLEVYQFDVSDLDVEPRIVLSLNTTGYHHINIVYTSSADGFIGSGADDVTCKASYAVNGSDWYTIASRRTEGSYEVVREAISSAVDDQGNVEIAFSVESDWEVEEDYNYCYFDEIRICGDLITADPTPDPTKDPTGDPSMDPTVDPTSEPTMEPTSFPTVDPTSEPTTEPTSDPTMEPTVSLNPTAYTDEPTTAPSEYTQPPSSEDDTTTTEVVEETEVDGVDRMGYMMTVAIVVFAVFY